MTDELSVNVVRAEDLTPDQRAEIINLCAAAYEEDFDWLFDLLPGSTHVIARRDDNEIVSHAEWVVRWLHPQGHAPLRTAYVEAVATAPGWQRRGCATTVMRELQRRIVDYDLGALSPSDPSFYARLGWESWRGPLAVRTTDGALVATPDEDVMVMRLTRTPNLDFDALLTAEWRDGELW